LKVIEFIEIVETQAAVEGSLRQLSLSKLGYLFLPKKVTEKGNLKIEIFVGQ
jgi:hypothetical protein